jgi:hypothetical protein
VGDRRGAAGLSLHDERVSGSRAAGGQLRGLHADEVARMVGDDDFAIYPRKGRVPGLRRPARLHPAPRSDEDDEGRAGLPHARRARGRRADGDRVGDKGD